MLGSKTTPNIDDYNFGGCKCDFFKINLNKKKEVINFLKEPALLTEKIIKKEKSSKGWYKKTESANYILEFRDKRSKSPDDMNCIEWIAYALELGGLDIPENILTADRLQTWASKNLKKIDKDKNLNKFQKNLLKMFNNIPVVILCGGYGTRISEETQIKPKPMVLIGNKPILVHIMNIYRYYGFNEFILALGYKSHYIKNFFSKKKNKNIKLIYTGKDTKTGGRLLRLKTLLKDQKIFMLTYGDGGSRYKYK